MPIRTNKLDVDFYQSNAMVNAEVLARLCDRIDVDAFLESFRLRVEYSISIREVSLG